MRITKHWLKTQRTFLDKDLRRLAEALFRDKPLSEVPELEKEFTSAHPYRTPKERPYFAAAALGELLYDTVRRSLPDHMTD